MRGHEMQSAELQALQRAANLPAAAADARREKLRGGQRRRGSAHGSRPGLLLLVRRPSQAVLREFQGIEEKREERIWDIMQSVLDESLHAAEAATPAGDGVEGPKRSTRRES